MGFDAENIIPPGANIKVIGVGGGGGNAVNTMIRSGVDGVEFIAANTDVQALRFALPERKIQIGKELTKGLGAGADPDVGRDAALEDRHEIQEALNGADMVFITAGMGGGTGTGGASVIAQIAREHGALTVGVVTKPFIFEGKRRRKHAELGIERLRESVDTLITIPNQRLLQIATPDLSMVDAFQMADDVLVNAVKGISDIINIPGTVNVDFADVKTVMSSMGMALMGIGHATGDNRAVEAARQAICSPLLEDVDIEGATGILINITAGSNISLMEVNEACTVIQDAAHEDANVIFGAVIDEEAGEDIRVTVIATGFPADFEDNEDIPGQAFKPKYPGIAAGVYNTRPARITPPRQAVEEPKQARLEPEEFLATPAAPADDFSDVVSEEPTVAAESELPLETPSFMEASQAFDGDSISANSEVEDLARLTMSAPQEDEPLVEELQLDLALETPIFEEAPAPTSSIEIEGATAKVEETMDHFEADSFQPMASPVIEEEAPVSNAAEVQDRLMDIEESAPAPMEQLFSQSEPEIERHIDNKIDEALELAEKLKEHPGLTSDEDLDVPAFLRTGIKDLSLD